MTADTKTLERSAERRPPAEPEWRRMPSRGSGPASSVEPEAHAPVRHADAGDAHARPGSAEPADEAPLDYWEEVALARLRLAQWALVVTLVASVIIALVLG